MDTRWARAAGTAAGQAGAIARSQIYDTGADRFCVRRWVRDRGLDDVGADVFVLPGAPDTLDRRRWIALLAAGPGSHLSHESAADLHRIAGIRRGLVVVTAAHPRHVRIPGGTLHQVDDHLPGHLTLVAGFPTTTPARTIVDLAAVVSWMRLSAAVEHVVVERQATFGAIAGVLREVRRRGKPGVHKLVAVLDARAGEPPPASVLEAKLLRAAAMARVGVVRQFPLPWAREPLVGLVDAAVPESRLILEADGRRWHARMQAMAHDRRRDREAVLAGWLPLRWVHEDLTDVPSVAGEIAAIHRSRVSG